MISRVLVSTDRLDDGRGEQAIAAAVELARAYDAELVVVDQASPLDLRQVLEPEVGHAEADDDIRQVVDGLRGVRARLRRAASGDPMKAVFSVAMEERADVVVVANLLEADAVAPEAVSTGDLDHRVSVPVPAAEIGGVHASEAPHGPGTTVDGSVSASAARRRHGLFRSFYSDRLGWLSLFLTSFLLAYGGGAVLFWLHAVYRGERGPAISDWSHWLLDSTLGFVALTPVLFLILPVALWVLARGDGSRRLQLWSYVTVVGTIFTLVTGPGPLLHNRIAGHGTWLADLATAIFGHDGEIAERNMHAMEHSNLTEGLLQIAVGLPVYVLLAWVALRSVQAAARRRTQARTPDQARLTDDGGK